MKRCSSTGKVRFPTQLAADQAVLDAKIKRSLRGKTKRRECRAYLCSQCEGWHLTSLPLGGAR